jgi:predicted nucleotidyltransferase
MDNVLLQIKEVCNKHHATKCILFGSRAKGTNNPRSDYDIAVDGIKHYGDFYIDLYNINTIFKIDIIFLDKCKNVNLLKEIDDGISF